MKIINLTGHSIDIVPKPNTQPNVRQVIAPSNKTVRVCDNDIPEYDSFNLPVLTVEVRAVEMPCDVDGMPEPQEDTYYIVSRLTAITLALSYNRVDDILFPMHVSNDTCKRLGCFRDWTTEADTTFEIVTEV